VPGLHGWGRSVSERRHLTELVNRYGCPLVAAAQHPEHRAELMALNAELEGAAPSGTTETVDRVQRALEDVLRARVRRARRAA
jgi:hypothetical protein